MIFKQLPTMVGDLNKLGIALKSLDAMKLGTVGVNLGNVEAYRAALKGLSVEQSVFALASKGATEEQIRQILVTNQATAEDVEAAMAKAGLTTATQALTQAEMVEMATKTGVAKATAEELLSKIGITATETGQIPVKKQVTRAMLEQAVASGTLTKAEASQIATMLGLNAVETANIGITNVLTASFTKLWAVITAHPIGAILTAIGAVAVGTIAYINKTTKEAEEAIVEAHENAKQALEDTKTSLSDDKSELQSVNSELETTKERLKEISSIGAPTLTEQNELTKLSTANAQLEAQQTLLENNIKLKQKAAALDAKELLGTQVEMEYSSILDGSSITSTTESYSYDDHAKYQASNLKNAYNIYMKALRDGDVKKQQLAQELIDASAGDSAVLTSELLEIVESFKYDDGTIIEGYEDLYNEYMGMIYNLQSLTNPDTFLEIAKLVTTGKGIDYEKAISEAYNLAYEGNFDVASLNQDFVKALADAGIDESTISYIFKLKQQEYQLLVDKINSKYDSSKVQYTYWDGEGKIHHDYEKENSAKADVEKVNQELNEYARENPIEFQLVSSYDEDFILLDKYIEEEKTKAENGSVEIKKAIEQELKELEQGGSVNLTLRPQIDTSELNDKGWDAGEGTATVFSSTYSNEAGDIAVNFTPIIADPKTGEYLGALSPDELQEYAEGVIAGTRKDDLNLQIGTKFEGEDAIKQAENSAIKVHELHEQFFLDSKSNTDSTENYISNAIQRIYDEAKAKSDDFGNEITVSFIDTLNSADYAEIKEKLLELAKAGELSPSVLESTEEYKTLLSQTGLLADEAYKKIMNLVSVNDRFVDMSSDMSNLANAYKEFKEDGFAKASTLDSLEQFKDLKSYKNFANIVGSKNTTSEQKQKAFNTLATEYLNEERALDKLNETNKDYYITQLKDLGIKNAKIIVEKALNTQEKASNLQAEYRKETGKDLVNVAEELNDATDSEKKSIISATKSFLKMNNATKTARLELFRLNAEEDIFANKDFEGNINLQVEKLFELANAFGVTAAMAKELGIAEDEANRDPLAGGKGYTKADLIHIRESIYKAIYGDYDKNTTEYKPEDTSKSSSSKDSKSEVDWIERKITSITSKIDDLNASYENLFTVKTKNDNISEQLKYQNSLLTANKKAADAYLNAFNGVKLGKDLKNKIINGDYSIKEYDSDTQSLISEAQGYYDNYRKYSKEIENTEKSIRENRIKKNQNIIDYSESKTAKYEAQLANATRYSTKSKLFKNERAEIRTNYDAQIRNAILNKDKQLEAQLKQQRATELRENFKKDFDALQQVYERKISATETKYDNIDKKIQLIETRGATANVSFYQTEKKINATKLTQLNAEKKALEKRLNSIKKGTDEYYEAKEAINEVNNSIQECTKSQYELNKAMTDMLVQRYTDRNDAIQRRIDEDEFIQSLYAGQQKMNKDTASFTKYGKADLDIYTANRLRAKAQADNNEELLNSLKKAEKQADGTYKTSVGGINYIFNSQKELNEAINNTYDNWKDTISSAYDYETKIVDSMKDKYQSQLDLMQELISKKKEALSIEKDLHDYQNQISEKTTNINNLKSQITAYQGDTSLEGMAKLQQLQKSLKEQEKDLRETEYDRFISDQEKMLDNLYEQYEEKIDTIINDFDLLLKQGIKIASTSDVKDTTADVINETANNNGYNTQFDAKDTYNTDNKISTNVKNEATKSNKNADKLSGTESIQKFIKDNVQKTKIKRKDLSYINQLIYDEYGKKVLSTSNLKKLAELVGVKYNGKTKKGNLYKELHSLKIPGFSKGGVVSVDDLYKQIKSNGDTTLASVKSGEGILTPLQTKQFTSLVSQLPNLNQSVIDYKALTRNIKSNPASYNNNVGDIILNIDLPNVTNPDEFVKAIQSNQKLQKTLRSVTIDMMNSNSTRLGVNRIK